MKRQHEIDINIPENYDDIYFGTRAVEVTNASPFLLNLLRIICKSGKVLDVGCGVGVYFPYFNNCEITGVDFTQKVLDEAKRKNPNLKIETKLQDIAKNGLDLFKNNTFDYVFCGEVIEHMEHPENIINEVRRVLKEGGTAIFTTPFENRIVCKEHLWEFDFYDLDKLFSEYTNRSIARFHNVYSADWEHFVIIATK